MSKPRPRPSRLILAALFAAFSMPSSAQSGPTPIPSPSPAARTSQPPATRMPAFQSIEARDLWLREKALRKLLFRYCLRAARLPLRERVAARLELVRSMDSLLDSMGAAQELIPETEWNALHFLLRQDDALLRRGPAVKNGAERQARAAETVFDKWAREELAKQNPAADDGPAVPEGKGSKAPPPTTPEPKPKPPTVPPSPAAAKGAAHPAASPARAKARPAPSKPLLVGGEALVEKQIPEKDLIAKQREQAEWVQRAAGALPGVSYQAAHGHMEYYGKLYRLPEATIVLRAHTSDQLHFLQDVKTRTRRIVSIADFDARGDHIPSRQVVEVFDAKNKPLKRVVYDLHVLSKGIAIETTPGAKGKPPRTRKRSISAAERKILLDPWKRPTLSREPSMVFEVPGRSRLLSWYDPSGRHPRLLPSGSRLVPMAGSPAMLQIVGRNDVKQGWYVNLDSLLNASTQRARHALALKLAAQVLPAIGITGQPRLVRALGEFLWDNGTPKGSTTHLLLRIDPGRVFTLLRVNSVGSDSVVRGKFYVGSDFGDEHWGKVSFLAMKETDLNPNYGFENRAGADTLAYEYRGNGERLDWGGPIGKELVDAPRNQAKAYFGDVGPDLNRFWNDKIERTLYTIKRRRYDEKKGTWVKDGQAAAYRAEHDKAGSSTLGLIAQTADNTPVLGHVFKGAGWVGNFLYTGVSNVLDVAAWDMDKLYGNSTDLDDLNIIATGSRNPLWTLNALRRRQPALFTDAGQPTAEGVEWMHALLTLLTPGARALLNEHVKKVLRPRWFEQAGLSPQTVGYETKINAPVGDIEAFMGLQDFGAGTRGRQIAEFGGGFWLTTASLLASGGETAGQAACNPLTWAVPWAGAALGEASDAAAAAVVAKGATMARTWKAANFLFGATVTAPLALSFGANTLNTLGQAAPKYDTPEGKTRLGEALTNLAAAGFLLRRGPSDPEGAPEANGGAASGGWRARVGKIKDGLSNAAGRAARVLEDRVPGGRFVVDAARAIARVAARVDALLARLPELDPTVRMWPWEIRKGEVPRDAVPVPYLMSYSNWSESATQTRERVPGYYVPDMATVAYHPTAKSVPDNWTMKGTAYDLMTLRPVPAATLKFISVLRKEGMPTKTNDAGRYNSEVPSLGTQGAYIVKIDKSGYLEQCLTAEQLPSNFRSLSAEQRRKLLTTITENAQLKPNSDDESVVKTDLYVVPEPKEPTEKVQRAPAPDKDTPDKNPPPPPGDGGAVPAPPKGHHKHPNHGGGGGGGGIIGGGGAPPAQGHPGTPSSGGSGGNGGGGGGGGGGGASGAPSAPSTLNSDFDQAGESAPPPLDVHPSFPSRAAHGGAPLAGRRLPARRQAPRPGAASAPASQEAPLGGHGTPENLAETAGHPFDNRPSGAETKASPVKSSAGNDLGLPHLPPLSFKNPFGTKKAGAPPENALNPALSANGAAPAAGPSGAAPEEGDGVAYMEPPADQFQPLREKAPAGKRNMSLPLDLGLRGAAFLAALYLLKYSELAYLLGLRRRPRVPPPSGNRDVA